MNKNHKVIQVLMIMLISLLIVDMASAQTKRRTSSRSRVVKEEKITTPLVEKLNTEIKLGNLAINGGFGISLKSNVGYKVTNWLSAGVGAKMFYNFINVPFGDDYSFFDYAGLTYVKAKVAGPFYVQGEYAYQHYDDLSSGRNIAYPLFGLGYMQDSGGMWSYGIELLFIADAQARDYSGSSLEYWINFSHRF